MDFGEAYDKLQEIVKQIKKKDLTLDKSLELLEEGVRLANICTEKIDYVAVKDHLRPDQSGLETPVAPEVPFDIPIDDVSAVNKGEERDGARAKSS